MTIELRDFRLIDAIAQAGSVTRASRLVHRTQSALSRQLGQLEARLGVRLFERRGRRLMPTPAAQRLQQHAREILLTAQRAEADVLQVAAAREGMLRISTECYTCYHWLPAILQEFERRCPRIELRIALEATYRAVPALLADAVDLAIVSSSPRNRRLHLTPLFADELVAVVPPGHPWQSRSFVTAQDLAAEHLVVYPVPRDRSRLFQEVLGRAGVAPQRVSVLPLTEAIVEMVKAGLGVGILANWAIARQTTAGQVHGVRITPKGVRRQWSAATLRRQDDSEHLQAFLRLLRQVDFGRPRNS